MQNLCETVALQSFDKMAYSLSITNILNNILLVLRILLIIYSYYS